MGFELMAKDVNNMVDPHSTGGKVGGTSEVRRHFMPLSTSSELEGGVGSAGFQSTPLSSDRSSPVFLAPPDPDLRAEQLLTTSESMADVRKHNQFILRMERDVRQTNIVLIQFLTIRYYLFPKANAFHGGSASRPR